MTSERKSAECYVYITLPGQTTPVTAGRFALINDRHGRPLGQFVYGRSYLARSDAVALDPIELKLARQTYETVRLRGVFGALRDASPDHWGRRIIERHLGKPQLSELDYLLHSPEDRAGALGFGLNQVPPAALPRFNRTLDLAKLQRIADALVATEELPVEPANEQVAELILLGTSMGGARPKTVVEDEQGLWLAKFNRADDRWNVARVEHAMLRLARTCGINVAESRVVSVADRDVLLVKRFDREKTLNGYLRARMVSALTLLRADEVYGDRERWSYMMLAEELRRASGNPAADAAELFRRMCFNALISNIDDHPRNHAILARDREFRLSPAYDLSPATPVSLERRDLALTVGDAGRFANAENILSQSARFLVGPDQAKALVDTMEQTVQASWYTVARGAGVSEADCGAIAAAFAYPGFRLPLRQ
jgi:serine/threonine-protein kinase HipA